MKHSELYKWYRNVRVQFETGTTKLSRGRIPVNVVNSIYSFSHTTNEKVNFTFLFPTQRSGVMVQQTSHRLSATGTALMVNPFSDNAKRSGSFESHLIPLFCAFPSASLPAPLGELKLVVHVPWVLGDGQRAGAFARCEGSPWAEVAVNCTCPRAICAVPVPFCTLCLFCCVKLMMF